METAATWVLSVLIACAPGVPGFCKVLYVAAESRDDCRASIPTAREAYADRFTRTDCARHRDWPAGVSVMSSAIDPPAMLERRANGRR